MSQRTSIGLGTAAIGRPLYINVGQDHANTSIPLETFAENGTDMLEAAYNSGIRHFDTAPNYGLAEGLLIDWIRTKNDPSLVVSTKWGYTYVANFDPKAEKHEVKEHSLEKLNEQWEVSKELLPHLKLYQIHSATSESGVLDNSAVFSRLHQLRERHGLVIGLTVTGPDQVEVINKALDINVEGSSLFESVQFTFNILDQSVLLLRDRLQKLQGPILIKEVLANGRLLPNTNYPWYENVYGLIKELGLKYGVGADAVVLRFAMQSFEKAVVLSGANTTAHLLANLMANYFSLTEEEMEGLQGLGISQKAYWDERKKLPWN